MDYAKLTKFKYLIIVTKPYVCLYIMFSQWFGLVRCARGSTVIKFWERGKVVVSWFDLLVSPKLVCTYILYIFIFATFDKHTEPIITTFKFLRLLVDKNNRSKFPITHSFLKFVCLPEYFFFGWFDAPPAGVVRKTVENSKSPVQPLPFTGYTLPVSWRWCSSGWNKNFYCA